jgi:hypothetical protein
LNAWVLNCPAASAIVRVTCCVDAMIVSPTGHTSVGAPVLSVEPSAAAVRFDPGPTAGASGVWTEQAIDAESTHTATAGYVRTMFNRSPW